MTETLLLPFATYICTFYNPLILITFTWTIYIVPIYILAIYIVCIYIFLNITAVETIGGI